LKFDWDQNKNKLNIEQHGLDFEFAKQIFDNDLLVVPDLRFNYQENRYIGYGKIEDRLMVVVYTERLPDIIRIISFRKANYRENKIYKKNKLE
jgi:uncharacterized DUF497 family protein